MGYWAFTNSSPPSSRLRPTYPSFQVNLTSRTFHCNLILTIYFCTCRFIFPPKMPPQGEKTAKKEDEEENTSLSPFRKKSGNGCGEFRSKVAKVKKEEPNEDGDVPDLKRSSKKVEKEKRTLSSSLTEKKEKKSMNDSVEAHASQSKLKKEEVKSKKKKKKKRMKEEEREAAAEQNVKKKKRKVYDLPGQKRLPPDERDPLRIFYETLYQKLPGSEMAALWMMENGLLPPKEAKKVYKKKQKRKQEQTLESPMKAVASVKRNVDSVTIEKSKAMVPSSPANSANKSVVESKTVSMCKKSSKRKNRDDDSDTRENEPDDDFILARRKTKKPIAPA